jgi:hypothetical protein
MEVPWYVDIIKTGSFKEQAPYDSDWYFTRAASIARTVYLKPGIGVQKFRKVYGALIPFATAFPAVSSHTLNVSCCALLSQVAPPRAAPAPNTTAMPPAACSAKSSSSSKTWASLSARPTAAAALPEPADATSTASLLR